MFSQFLFKSNLFHKLIYLSFCLNKFTKNKKIFNIISSSFGFKLLQSGMHFVEAILANSKSLSNNCIGIT